MNHEIWKEINGAPDYEVSNYGGIRSWKPSRRGIARAENPRALSKQCDGLGYEYAAIKRHGKRVLARVHRLVAEAFCPGMTPEANIVRHLNDVRRDNRAENLAWGTRADNAQDRINLGTMIEGEQHPMARLTDAQVLEIYNDRSQSGSATAAKYGIHQVTVNDIWNKNTRKRALANAPDRFDQIGRRASKLSSDAVMDIFGSITTHSEMARKYGVSETTVLRIRQRALWAHVTKDMPDLPRPHVRVGVSLSERTGGLSEEAITDVFMSMEPGLTLAKKYGVSNGTISDIRNRRIATSFTCKLRPPIRAGRKLTKDEINAIRTSPGNRAAIARLFGIHPVRVWRIKRGLKSTPQGDDMPPTETQNDHLLAGQTAE